ncbi:MAG TPA: AsmA family protein, partial [Myxococcota bacterium]
VDGGKQSPVDIGVTLATLPKGLKFDPLPDLDVRAALTDVDLAPWGGMLPVDSPAPVGGILRANVTAALKQDMAVVDVAGTINARGLVLRDAIGGTATKADRAAAPKGTPLDLDVDLDAHMNDKTVLLRRLTAKGTGADVTASLKLEGSGIAGLKEAAVDAKVADLGKFLTALPPSLRGLPETVLIDGPVAAVLSKNGADLKGNLNLDGARVRYTSEGSTSFDKSAGKALHLDVTGKDAGKSLDISELALVLDTVKLGGTVSVPLADDEPLAANIHSGAVSLASLQGMVPPFREAIGKGNSVAGTLSIDVTASADGKRQLADAAVAFKGLDVNLASVIVKGNGDLKLKAAPGGSDVSIVAVADFDGLQVKAVGDDGNATLDKPAGQPLRLDVDVVKKTSSATVNAVKLVIGRSSITGKGSVDDIGGKNERVAVDFGTVDIAFNDVRTAVPGAAVLPAGGRVRGAVSLRGGLSAEKLGVDIKGLDVAFGSSSVKGTIGVDNLSAPKLEVDLPTVNLAFNDLKGFAEALKDLPGDGRYEGSVKVKGDTAKLSTMDLEAKITKLVAAKSDLAGSITVKNLDKPQFLLETKSNMLDVDALTAAFGGSDSDDEATKKPTKDENPHGLGKAARDMLAGVNGKATMTATKAVVKDMKMSNFVGNLVMKNGVATFETLTFGFYGGTVTASGTSLGLPQEKTGWDIRLEGDNVDFGAFLSDQTKLGKLFKGTVSPKVGIKGKGLAFSDFVVSADGPAAMSFKEFVIGGIDLLGPLNDAIKKATAGKASSFNAQNAKGSQTRGLVLNDFTALTEFVGGKLKLQKPVEAKTPFGPMKITGASGLDSTIDFDSILSLTPATISTMTGGKLKVKNDVPVPFKIGGTWDAPRITGFDVGALVKALLGEQVAAIVDKGKDAVEDALKAEKDKAKDKADEQADKAKARAKEEADKAKAKAKEEADKAKKKAAEQAKKEAEKALGGLLGGKKK